MTIKNAVSILVNEKGIPEKIKRNEVYVLYYTEPGEDGMCTASRTSIHLFKNLKSLARYLCEELGLETEDELRDNFQNTGEKHAYAKSWVLKRKMSSEIISRILVRTIRMSGM